MHMKIEQNFNALHFSGNPSKALASNTHKVVRDQCYWGEVSFLEHNNITQASSV